MLFDCQNTAKNDNNTQFSGRRASNKIKGKLSLAQFLRSLSRHTVEGGRKKNSGGGQILNSMKN